MSKVLAAEIASVISQRTANYEGLSKSLKKPTKPKKHKKKDFGYTKRKDRPY